MEAAAWIYSLLLELAVVGEANEQRGRHAGACHRQPRPQQRHFHSPILLEIQRERRGVVRPVGLGPERVCRPAVLLLPAGAAGHGACASAQMQIYAADAPQLSTASIPRWPALREHAAHWVGCLHTQQAT